MTGETMDGFERTEVELAGGRLAGFRRPGVGPPIVLLPGGGGNAWGFADLAAALPGPELLLIDPPGAGDSDPAWTFDLGKLVDGLAEWADGQPEPCLWAGHSWGGKVAAVLAGRHPDLVSGLVLIDPSPGSTVPLDDEALRDFARTMWDGDGGPWASAAEAVAAQRSRPQYRCWTANLAAAIERSMVPRADGRWTTRATLAELTELANATLRVDYSTDAGAIRCPTLYLVASRSVWWQEPTNDVVLPDHVERVEIDGRHLLHVDNLGPVAAAFRRFLAGLG